MAITIGDAVMRMSLDRGNFNRDVKRAEADTKKAFKRMGDSTRKFGQSLKKMRVPLLAVTGILGGMGVLALKFAADFEKGMREVNTLINLSEDQLDDLSESVRELSVEFGLNAVDATKALYQAISKGSDPQQALLLLNVAARTAIGGVTDLETAVDGLTSIMNAFGIEQSQVERVADVLFQTMKGGGTTIGELSNSFFQAAPIAAVLNVSFEEIAAATATITKAGVPTRIAMTGLRAAMVALAKPTDEMSDLLEQIGFKSSSAAFETLGLQGTFQKLLEAVDNDTDALIAAGLQVESLNAVFGITGDNAEAFAADFDSVTNAAGSMNVAFEEMEDTASQKMAKMSASMNELKLVIGDILLPIVTELVDGLRTMIDVFSDMPKPLQIAAVAIGGVTLALGFLGLILPPVIGGVILFTGAITAANIAMAGWVAVGLAAIAVAFLLGSSVQAAQNAISNLIKGTEFAVNPLQVFKNQMAFLGRTLNETKAEMLGLEEQTGDSTAELQRRLADVSDAIDSATGVSGALERMGTTGVEQFGLIGQAAQSMFDIIKSGNDQLLAFEQRARVRAQNIFDSDMAFAEQLIATDEANRDKRLEIQEQLGDAAMRRQESLRRGLKSTADFEIAEAIRVAETAEEELTAAQEEFKALQAEINALPSVSGGFSESKVAALTALANAARERREAIARGDTVMALPGGANAGGIFGSAGPLPGIGIFRNPGSFGGGAAFITPQSQLERGRTADITIMLDGRQIARAVGAPLVDEITVSVGG